VGKEEFNRVYRRHYLKDRSRLKVKFCKKLNNLRLYFETRSKSYKCEISKILKIIRDNNGIAE
jgi:hypothetical protein